MKLLDESIRLKFVLCRLTKKAHIYANRHEFDLNSFILNLNSQKICSINVLFRSHVKLYNLIVYEMCPICIRCHNGAQGPTMCSTSTKLGPSV